MTVLKIGAVHGNVLTGDLTIERATVGTLHAHGALHIHQLVAQPPPFSLQAPPAPPARQGARGPKPPKRDITPAQRDVLALMRPLPKPVRVDVLIWMRVEFGTSLVMDLDPRELHRLRGHVLGVCKKF